MQNTKEFFEGWLLYQKVIKLNYMRHREVTACLTAWAAKQTTAPFRILDLGCGDAYMVRTVFHGRKNIQYCGIDLSGPALEIAREKIGTLGWESTLVEGDLAERVHEAAGSFDLILAGYSLHHLQNTEKRHVLKTAHSLLADTAALIIYDILPESDESRETFLSRYLADTDANWTQLTEEQLASIREHVETYDFPIDRTTWNSLAEETGYRPPELLYRDSEKHYGILKFTG